MFFARKPFVRSTTLLAACAASFILLSSGSAQQRDSRLELAAVGQQPPSPVLNPSHPDTYVVKQGDTLWDIAHTAIRPVGGALIAVATLGEASPGTQALIALLGGTVAASSHLTKTSTRAAANASPEPFSNWFLSLGEDVFVVGLGYLAMSHPLAALIVGLVLLVVIASFAVAIIRTVRRWFRRVPA